MLPFHHSGSSHNEIEQLNVFLVTLNAEIKFQHYNLLPLSLTPLSDGVLKIMNKTIMLVDEIYKKPILPEMLIDLQKSTKAVEPAQQTNSERATRPGSLFIDCGLSGNSSNNNNTMHMDYENCSATMASLATRLEALATQGWAWSSLGSSFKGQWFGLGLTEMLRKGMRRETEGNKREMGKNRGESRDMAVREGRLWGCSVEQEGPLSEGRPVKDWYLILKQLVFQQGYW